MNIFLIRKKRRAKKQRIEKEKFVENESHFLHAKSDITKVSSAEYAIFSLIPSLTQYFFLAFVCQCQPAHLCACIFWPALGGGVFFSQRNSNRERMRPTKLTRSEKTGGKNAHSQGNTIQLVSFPFFSVTNSTEKKYYKQKEGNNI